jgi:prevent-host-death family protein
MRDVNLADAKAHLSALVEQAAAGEPVRIIRRGKPVAQLTALQTPRKAIDPAALRSVTGRMRAQAQDAGAFMRAVRDQERY